MSNLPQNWAETTLGELSEYITSGSRDWSKYYANEGALFIRTQDINKNKLSEIDGIARVKLPNTVEGKRTLVKTYDLLVTITGANVGKCALIKDSLPEAYVSQSVALIRLIDKSLASFLHRQLLAPDPTGENFNTWLEENAYGMGRPVLSLENMRSVPIKLPPQPEQKRIADKLDAVLARVDACRDRLDRIPAILKRFRQAVLAAATSGVLTEDWRSETNTADWHQSNVQSVAQVGTGSTPLRSNPAFFSSSGTPWVTSSATSLTLVTSAEEFVTQAAITAHRLKTYPIGTLLVAMYGEGKTRGQVTELGISATINQACAAVVVNEEIALKNYVKLALQANYYEMREMAEGGNQPNLNLSKIKEFLLPLPSIKEQIEIVRRIESLFTYADRLEARYKAARAQVEKLTPSLLAKAFRGELVPQDPNDEPASELLARIRATKAEKTTKPKRGRTNLSKS